MSRIKLLPETLASQVAAGEVVERPGSVVKELVENSIDAGARNIEVRIHRGGISLIRVIDDGCGMDRDDALLSLERHATSKIDSLDDLVAINTLGFRGEALPSIASVSRLRLATRERDSIAGTEIIVNGGRIEAVRDGGEAPGTQIEVRSLFFNVPARRKFLRAETTETRNIEHQFFLHALSHPAIGFTIVRDDKFSLQLPISSSLRDRIRDLYDAQLIEDLLEVIPGDASTRVSGWIGRAGVSRQTRNQQFVFVNGRPIESPLITNALREGYHTALMKGQYPVTFLSIALNPKDVDVNVHPAKREVRFRNPPKIHEAVVAAVQRTLTAARKGWQEKFQSSFAGPIPDDKPLPGQPVSSAEIMPSALPIQPAAHRQDHDFVPSQIVEPAREKESLRNGSPFQIIGVLNRLYVLMENSEGLVLVDQHAAHERILFEELRRRMEEQGVPSQRLLLPQIFSLPPRDAEWVERNIAVLQKMGIGVENFGGTSFRIDSLPSFLQVADAGEFLREVIDELIATSRHSSPMRLGEDMIATTVCRHAIKANDALRHPEIEKLIHDLLACELPYCCPHGRPTMIQISLTELEKKFGRKA
ncbi:MAG TPA: DNA mismatch repair endonuclease MutL [Chthoniobacterales bacterium]